MGKVIFFPYKQAPTPPRRRINLFETAGLAIGKELDDYFSADPHDRKREAKRLEDAMRRQTIRIEVPTHDTTEKGNRNETDVRTGREQDRTDVD